MKTRRRTNAQAMVEFALALPIFLLVLIGLLEVGRVMFMYAAVAEASREAARYASGWGVNDASNTQYRDCPAIRATAKRVGFLLNLQDSDIIITYDHGPGVTTPAIPNCTSTTGPQSSVTMRTGDRVMVTINYQYSPIVPLIPFTARTISSGPSARTVTGRINLISPTSAPTSGPTAAPTLAPTPGPTSEPTIVPTAGSTTP